MKDHSLFRACAKVDLGVIKRNIESIRSAMRYGTGLVGVVKADAYGHGAIQVAEAIKDEVCAFAVATPEEALSLREAIKDKPIYVLGYSHPDAYEELIRADIVTVIYRYSDALRLSECAEKLGKKAKVNIKVDTGMGRIGIPIKEAKEESLKIAGLAGLEVSGTLMHFPASDSDREEDIAFSNAQQENFESYIKACSENDIAFLHRSSASSAAFLKMPNAQINEVRVGILMYGYYPFDAARGGKVRVTPALSLHSHIIQIKEIDKGESVGYGRSFVAENKMRIATVPVGYGDGYPRLLSNRGRVLIRGEFAPIVGRICMDMFMVDVTHITEAAELDEVVLLGTQGENKIDADDLAELTGTISYEILCDIGKRVPRVYI